MDFFNKFWVLKWSVIIDGKSFVSFKIIQASAVYLIWSIFEFAVVSILSGYSVQTELVSGDKIVLTLKSSGKA